MLTSTSLSESIELLSNIRRLHFENTANFNSYDERNWEDPERCLFESAANASKIFEYLKRSQIFLFAIH